MPAFRRTTIRLLTAAGLSLAALVPALTTTPPHAAAAAGSPCGSSSCLAVYVDNRSQPQIVSASTVGSGDFPGTNDYHLRAPDQACTTQGLPAGTSVSGLLSDDISGIDSADVDHVMVERPGDGTMITLDKDEIAPDPSGVTYGGELPVFSQNGDQVEFFRPLLAHPDPCPADGDAPSSSADANAGDQIFPTSIIDVYVNEGPLLDVTLSAPSGTVRPGDPVTVTASIANATSGVHYRYGYSVPSRGESDSPTSTGRFQTTFSQPGTYLVDVMVTGNDASSGSAATVITVGKPPSKKPSGGTGPHGKTHHQPTTRPAGTGWSPSPSFPRAPALKVPAHSKKSSTSSAFHIPHIALPNSGGADLHVRGLSSAGRAPQVAKPSAVQQPQTVSGELLSSEGQLVAEQTAASGSASSADPALTAPQHNGWGWWFGLAAAILLVVAGAGREWLGRRG